MSSVPSKCFNEGIKYGRPLSKVGEYGAIQGANIVMKNIADVMINPAFPDRVLVIDVITLKALKRKRRFCIDFNTQLLGLTKCSLGQLMTFTIITRSAEKKKTPSKIGKSLERAACSIK